MEYQVTSDPVMRQQQKPFSEKFYPQDREQLKPWRTWLAIFVLIVIFQASFYISVGVAQYSIIFLEWKPIFVLIVISLLQYKIPKFPSLTRWMVSTVKPLLYCKKFQKIYQQQIDPQQKCVFGFHPHSIYAFCCLSNMNIPGDRMENMIGLCSKFILNVPVTGLLLRLWGLQSVDPKNLRRVMKSGKDIGLVPGGFQQATLTTPNQMRVFLKNRKGFIKYALKYGYAIYPIIVMNEHKAYWTFDYLLKWRMLLNKIKLPGVIFWGKLGIIFRTDLQWATVVGRGIKGKDDSKQQVERCHQEYVKQLERIYEKYRKLNYDVPFKVY